MSAIIPIIKYLATAGAAAGGMGIGESVSPGVARLAQFTRRDDPVWIPDAQSIIAAMQRGTLNPIDGTWALSSTGVSLIDTKPNSVWSISPRDKVWQGVSELLMETPQAQDVVAAHLRGLIDPELANRTWRRAGVKWDDWKAIADVYRQRLTPTDLVVLFNRDYLTKQQFYNRLINYGGYVAEDLEGFEELSKLIPGQSDLIRFAVREAFDPPIAESLGYYDEYPALLDKWLKAQGMAWPLGFNIKINGVDTPAHWGHLYWAAHWQTIPPTIIYRLFHRFRGNPDEPETWRVPGVKPFTQADVDKHLKVDDYPAPVREWLREASYVLPGRRQLSQQYRAKVITSQELEESYRDLGFSETQARRARENEDKAIQKEKDKPKEQRKKALQAKTAERTLRLYKLGGLDRGDLDNILGLLDWDNESIAAAAAIVESDIQAEELHEGTIAVRRSYLMGAISEFDAQGYLIALGVREDHARRVMARWNLRKTIPHQSATTARWIDYYKRGIIQLDMLYRALKNLGWSDPEAALNMLAAEQDRDEFILRQLARGEAKARAAARLELERLRRAKAAAKEAQANLMKHSSPARMKQWLLEDLIERDQVRERLAYLGWPVNDIERYLSEVFDEPLPPEI